MEAPIQQPQHQPAAPLPAEAEAITATTLAATPTATPPPLPPTTTTVAAPAPAPAAPASAQPANPPQHDHHKPAPTTTRRDRRQQPASGPSSKQDTGGPPLAGQEGSQAATQVGALTSMAYQQKHALHRLKRLKKRAPHRDLVISFVPRLRTSIINRLDFFHRYSKQEQEVLSCFDFLDELIVNFCDGGLCESSPRYSQKLYQSMIYQLI